MVRAVIGPCTATTDGPPGLCIVATGGPPRRVWSTLEIMMYKCMCRTMANLIRTQILALEHKFYRKHVQKRVSYTKDVLV